MSLQDQIQLLREENQEQNSTIIDNTGEATSELRSLSDTMRDLLDAFQGNAQEDEERRRDSQSGPATPTPAGPAIVESASLDMLLGLPAAILGFARGLAAGWLGAVTDTGKLILKAVRGTFNTILRAFQGMLSGIGALIRKLEPDFIKDIRQSLSALRTTIMESRFITGLRNLGPTIANEFRQMGQGLRSIMTDVKIGLAMYADDAKKFFRPVTSMFANLSNAFKAGQNGVKGLSTAANGTFRSLNVIEKGIRQIGRTITGAGKIITDTGKSVRGAFTAISTSFAGIGKFVGGIRSTITGAFKPITNTINYLRTTFPAIFSAFGTLGRLLGWPLTIIIGLVSGIKASIAKFSEGDLLGGGIAFITGAINGAVLSIVDMFKNGISWLASKLFGEDNPVTTFLNSFSFEELFTTFMTNVETFIRSIPEKVTALVDNVKDFFTGFMEAEDPIAYLMEPISQMIQDIKDFVLSLIPSMDDIKNFASGGLDAVTSFFGGDDQQTPPPSPAPDIPVADAPESASSPIPEVASPVASPAPSRKEKQIEVAERKVALAEQKLKEEPNNTARQIIYEKAKSRVSALKGEVEKPTPAVVVENNTEKTEIAPPQTSMRMATGQMAQEQSKENAQLMASNIAMPIINAPSQVTNNTSNNNTAAIIDNNLPTIDMNDRSFGIG